MVAFQRFVRDDGNACTLEMLSDCGEVLYEKGGMSLLGGAEISFDAKMGAQAAALEPPEA